MRHRWKFFKCKSLEQYFGKKCPFLPLEFRSEIWMYFQHSTHVLLVCSRPFLWLLATDRGLRKGKGPSTKSSRPIQFREHTGQQTGERASKAGRSRGRGFDDLRGCCSYLPTVDSTLDCWGTDRGKRLKRRAQKGRSRLLLLGNSAPPVDSTFFIVLRCCFLW